VDLSAQLLLFRTRVRKTIASGRFPVLLATHIALAALSGYLALWLRFDGAVPPGLLSTFLQLLPWVLLIRGIVFALFGLYGGLWRYTGVWDLSRIIGAVFLSSAALYGLLYYPLGPAGYPRSIVVIDAVLLISFLGGIRLLWRILPGSIRLARGQRVLIVGAGDAGEMIVREMQRKGSYRPVGFVDDDPAKMGRTIHGVKVHGTRRDLASIVKRTRPTEVLVAIPSAPASLTRSLVQQLEPFKLSITTLPNLQELVNGEVGIKEIRPLAIADLLPRAQVAMDDRPIREMIAGSRVLVTGAGGSIGSELCRQIASLGPERLILYERYENGLYAVANDLTDRRADVPLVPVIGDITDRARVDAVFAAHRPHLVFHAAAHKHVPLMEANPCEAVKNNVLGTQIIAVAARRYGVDRFVLISTDKAANPANVMGATKRAAELIVQEIGGEGRTRFSAVRFGNVLGSNGSVLPRMLEQIRSGGPVTVTHPDMERYFMLIPEAVQLVLQAAVLADNQDTFVLDMGEQIKVLDLARNLIRLSGFVPEKEIPITFIGLRPGEKLTEELTGSGEDLELTDASKVFRVRPAWPPGTEVSPELLRAVIDAAAAGHTPEVLSLLQALVPTFSPLDVPELSRTGPGPIRRYGDRTAMPAAFAPATAEL
jgi:FlaA1/EpsC-like NDP-sugar epimerase